MRSFVYGGSSLGLSLVVLAVLVGCAERPQPSAPCLGTEGAVERLLMQQIGPDRAIIKWRGDASAVCVGTDQQQLSQFIEAETLAGAGAVPETSDKRVVVTGLIPETRYYYSVGGASTAQANRYFTTAPLPGKSPKDENIHVLILGDSGTATEFARDNSPSYPGVQASVLAGFWEYNGAQANNEPIDLLLLLGDSAYPSGTDAQWQGAYFDVYPEVINKTMTLPTIGNHDMGNGLLDICLFQKIPGCEKGPVEMSIGGVSFSADVNSYDSDGDGPDVGGMPYLRIFDLPSQGELGGVPSGTEQYYSADYGNLHIVSLDSQLSTQNPQQMSAMHDWLVEDLSTTRQPWTVVIFHHPPYSKGENHNSDLEQREIDMRQVFAPVFEDYGVDVVYSGHSHSYERSWYLNGHYGMSDTFDATVHAQLDATGSPSLGQTASPYSQVSERSGKDDRTVYTVAGNGGKADVLAPCPEGQTLGCTMPDWLQHPAHRTFTTDGDTIWSNGIARVGSVVLDVKRDQLTSTMVDRNGEVLDYFIIQR